MNILSIRFARLGDVILLLPALARLKQCFPDSRLTLLTGRLCAPLAGMCPSIDEVMSVDRIAIRDSSPLEAVKNVMRLASDVRARRFDLAVDFHGLRETNALAWFSRAPRRLGLRRFNQSYLPFCFNMPPVVEDKSLHVSEMFMKVVERLEVEAGAPQALPVSPVIAVPDDAREWFRRTIRPGPLLVLYLDAPVSDRRWPAEHFAAIADEMVERTGATVAALAGPDGDAVIRKFLDSARNHGQVHALWGLPISHLAAVIEAGRLFVTNDTGPMHLGPALGVPTLGLFSVGFPEHFRPTGPADRFLRGIPIGALPVQEVSLAVSGMWAAIRPDLRR